MQRICDRTLDRLVVLRKWSIGKCREWSKDATDAFGIHDERSHVIRRFRIDFEIRHVVAEPFLLRLVPPDLPALVVPGFPCGIARSAVVHNAAVSGPRPRPVRVNTKAGWIVGASSLHLRTGLSPRTGIEPVAARGCAVILQPGEPRQLLSSFDRHARLSVESDIRKRFAVDLF